MTTTTVGILAPDFVLTDVDGESIRLSDYRGHRNVVLVFLRGFL
jgi:peroxiredoxin